MTQPTAVPPTPGTRAAPTPGTRELPVDLPGVPSAAPTAAGEVLPTGPVGFVPDPGDAGTPPLPASGAARAAGPYRPQATAGAPRSPTAAKSPRSARSAKAAEGARGGKGAKTPGDPRRRAAGIGTGLAVLGTVLLEGGLLLGFGTRPLWSSVTLWSAFATFATSLVFLPVAGPLLSGARLRLDTAWRVAAGGLTGVAVFWVLVVLPAVDSDRGFVLTAALAALGAALWVAPARRT